MKMKMLGLLVLSMCTSSLLVAQQRVSTSLVVSHSETASSSDVMNYSFDSDGGQKKSVPLAVVYSLLVPGMGQTYVGSFRTGKYYLFAEGGLWLSYAGFQVYGNWLHQDAQSYATAHASANFSGKDDQFEVNIGNFNTTDDYNQEKLHNDQYALLYKDSQYQWDWGGNAANRLQFKNIRTKSAAAYDNSRFLIGAVVVNHILSAFMAGRAAAAYNRSLADEQSWHIEALALGSIGNVHGMGLLFTKTF
jgi:hypothetical protein